MRTKTLKNTLVLLLAALALTFFAACSESDPDPAYCGTWTPTDALISYLNKELESTEVKLSTDILSLTINSNGTVSISAIVNISGTYTYSGSDSSGTFKFALDLDSLGTSIATMAEPIAEVFTDNTITYTTGSLSAVLDNTNTVIFTK